MKTTLDKAVRWGGKTYLPGAETEIPDDLAKAMCLVEEEPPSTAETPPAPDESKATPEKPFDAAQGKPQEKTGRPAK